MLQAVIVGMLSLVLFLGQGGRVVEAACAERCRNAAFLGSDFWWAVRNSDNTISVFRNGFLFSPQPGGTTPNLISLQVFSGQVFLAVRGTGTQQGVFVNRWTGSSWTGWIRPQQGSTTNSPDMSVFSNSVHLAIAGTDLPNRGLWLNRYTSAWLGWVGIANLFTSAQTCASSSLRVGGCRTDGQCWRLTTTNLGTWSGPTLGNPCP